MADARGDQEAALSQIFRTFMHKETCTIVSTYQSLDDLAITFKFFLDKVQKITSGLRDVQSEHRNKSTIHDRQFMGRSSLEYIVPATEEEVCKIIHGAQ